MSSLTKAALGSIGNVQLPPTGPQPNNQAGSGGGAISQAFTNVQQAKLDTLSTILIHSANSTLPPEEHAANIHRAFAALDGGKLLTKEHAKELAGAVADVAETYHKTGDLRAAILGAVLNFFGHK